MGLFLGSLVNKSDPCVKTAVRNKCQPANSQWGTDQYSRFLPRTCDDINPQQTAGKCRCRCVEVLQATILKVNASIQEAGVHYHRNNNVQHRLALQWLRAVGRILDNSARLQLHQCDKTRAVLTLTVCH